MCFIQQHTNPVVLTGHTLFAIVREDIHEIKTSIKELRPPPVIGGDSKEVEKAWQPIVIELIKLAGLCVAILGAIVGAIKLMGG